MIASFLALILAIVALIQAVGAKEEIARLKEELRALRAERRAAGEAAAAATVPAAPSAGSRPVAPPPVRAPGHPPADRAAASHAPESAGPRLTPEELRMLEQFIRRRARLAPEARERIVGLLAARFEPRFERGDQTVEEYLVALHRSGGRPGAARPAPKPAPAPATPAAGPAAPPPPGPEPEPALSGSRSSTTGAEAEARSSEPRRRGLDLETQVGATWALRVGLAALAIAVALFARTIVPSLTPALKVGLAYAGALALFGVGRVFEARQERFARPVMAGALAIGFFVSYASHFVPAMRAVALVPALVWMAAGVIAVLVLAERWGSERTAGLAIFLGHVSAYVAGGVTDVYSLVVVLFLAVAAVLLLWRHDWLPLSLFAVAASYGSHLLWALADRSPAAAGFGIVVNLAFLASYYGIFLGADLIGWRRRAVSASAPPLARALGPVNLVLAVSLTTFLYLASDGPVERLSWVFFGLGALQAALAPLYRRMGNPDHRFYPALGAVLVTLGFAAALDGLSLNLVLALEAIALLVAAHATRMRSFHLLAQAALAANFVHYWTVDWLQQPDLASYIGGLAIAAAYLTQAVLEEGWYGRGDEEWKRDPRPAGATGAIARAFDVVFGRVAPALAYLHAFAAAVLIGHQSLGYLGSPEGLLAMGVGAGVLALGALALRSVPVMLAAASLQVGIAVVAQAWRAEPGLLLGLTAAGIVSALVVTVGARARGFIDRGWQATIGLAQIAVLAALQLPLAPWASAPSTSVALAGWLGALALAAAFIEVGRVMVARVGPSSEDFATLAKAGAALTALMTAIGALVVLERLVGGVAAPVWASGLAAALVVAALWREQPAFTLTALVMLVIGDAYWLVGEGLGADALDSAWRTAVLAGVPLAVGAVQDRLGPVRLLGSEVRLAGLATYSAYLLGSAIALAWCEIQLPEAWSSVAFAALPAALVALSKGAAARRGVNVAMLLALLALVDQATYAVTTSATGFGDLLAPGLLLAAAALAFERVLAVGAGGWRRSSDGGTRLVALGLLLGATMLALVTVQASWWLGGVRTTIGWSVVGGMLMAAGFATRSADYRRVALAVLGLAVIRVFAVDTRGLSDTAKTLAFFALGLSLVGVAWLYSRFGRRLRDWL